MAISITNKIAFGIVSGTALGGMAYLIHAQFSIVESVKSQLIKNLKNPLDISATSGEDFELLRELVKQHRSTNTGGKIKISDLTLSSDNDIEPLKKKCESLFKSAQKDEKFRENFSYAEIWCIKEKAPWKISILLKKQGRELLKNDSTTEWNKPWETFKEKYKLNNPSGNWNIENWDSLKPSVAAPKEFKDKCVGNGAGVMMLNSNQKFLNEIEEYCTKVLKNE